MLMEDVVTPLLEGDIVVVSKPIITMDPPALPQQELRQMEADEAGAAGDECCTVVHLNLDLRSFAQCHRRASKKIMGSRCESLVAAGCTIEKQAAWKSRSG